MRLRATLVMICLFSLTQVQAQEQEFRKIESDHFDNLYQVSDSLYRSEQPSKKGFRELEALGIKTVINFRRRKDDTRKAKRTELQLERIPLKASELLESNDLLEALRLMHQAEKPMLIHCWQGSDRTGVLTAAYRVVVENWPKEKAIEEFRYPPFGYHEDWYPNLVGLILNLDTEQLRRELGID